MLYEVSSVLMLPALQLLDSLLERAVSKAQLMFGVGKSTDPYRGLYVSSEDAERALIHRSNLFHVWDEQERSHFFQSILNVSPNLYWLKSNFDLSDFDIAIILITIAPDLDLRYERIYGYLQDDVTRKRPTVDFVLNLLCLNDAEKVARSTQFDPDLPLIRRSILHLVPDSQTSSSRLAHFLKFDDSIRQSLLRSVEVDWSDASQSHGQRPNHTSIAGTLDEGLRRWCRLSQPEVSLDSLPLPGDLKYRLQQLIKQTPNSPILYFYGTNGIDPRRIAEAIALHLHAPLLVFDLTLALQQEIDSLIPLLQRDMQLHQAILYGHSVEILQRASPTIVRAFLSVLTNAKTVVCLSGQTAACLNVLGSLNPIAIALPSLTVAQQRAYWQTRLNAAQILIEDELLELLSSRFRLSLAQIDQAIATALSHARWNAIVSPLNSDSGEGSALKVLPEELLKSVRLQSGFELQQFAQKIESGYTWHDLILPDEPLSQLKELCVQLQYRHRVYQDWGFERKLAIGKGVNALFWGSPGTGKTMAAGVIANALQLDLYKIDLAQIVSKYIGETEKNLDRIFTAAQQANAVLFFDEADALFGKRTEVKDAHDRYANLEVSYLLQKMEEYEGLAILATNLRQNLDDAFVRRLRFIVEIPFPDEAQRSRIWQTLFPVEAPLDESVDFCWLAQRVQLTGGHLKNIAIAAAFYAAEEGDRIQMQHLIKAAQREYQKIGRIWSEVE